MVDTRVGRPTFLPSYRVTERRCTGHSSGHSMHDCANPAAVLVANSYIFFVRANARKESSSRRLQAFYAGGCAILHLVGSSYCKARCNLALSAQAVISQGHLNACEK